MKILLGILLLIGGGEEFKGNVSEFNKVKREAEFAFNDEDYQKATERYSYLIDSLNYKDDNARLNLAHSYYHMDEIEKAKNMYSGLSTSTNKEVKSIANQQLGVFESRGKNLEKSLEYFKKSLMANPNNEEARYNYELVAKKLKNDNSENQENQKPQKPSEYAKQMKAKADQFASEGLFSQANEIMKEALANDKTTNYYQSFMKKLNDVSTIDEKY